jgi:hypothetical protein
MPATLPYKFQWKPDGLNRMADAIGPEAYRGGHDGQPNKTIMLGASARSTASRIINGVTEPSGDAVATAAMRHAEKRGIPWEEALAELVVIVPAGRPALTASAGEAEQVAA